MNNPQKNINLAWETYDKEHATCKEQSEGIIEETDCSNKALLKNIAPLSINPGPLYEFTATRAEHAYKIKKGEITKEEANILIQKAYAKLVTKESEERIKYDQERAKSINEARAKRAEVIQRGLGQIQQNNNNYYNNTQQILKNAAPKTTNTDCYMMGTTLKCNSTQY